MSTQNKEFGIVILLVVLGTRQRLIEDVDKYLIDWDSVLNRLDENVCRLENLLSDHRYRIGISTKDIFDNIQIFYPTDGPDTKHVDLTGSSSIWWSLQHSAELLTNLTRYAITKNILHKYGLHKGVQKGYYSKAMVENADLANSIDMIGVLPVYRR
jgi:hypothetical protein